MKVAEKGGVDIGGRVGNCTDYGGPPELLIIRLLGL